MKTLMLAFVAIAVTVGASAAQAGPEGVCTDSGFSVHGVWDCR